jgi:hypothetical protein
MSIIRPTLCAIGIHKWDQRAVHLEEPMRDASHLLMAVIEHCACGASRIAPSGGAKPTCWVVPEKYARIPAGLTD